MYREDKLDKTSKGKSPDIVATMRGRTKKKQQAESSTLERSSSAKAVCEVERSSSVKAVCECEGCMQRRL